MPPLRLFSLRLPRFPTPLPGRRFITTTTPSISMRLRSRTFWHSVLLQYRTALKLAVLINAGILTLQLGVHLTLQHISELSRPTPGSWPILARYNLRLARLPNTWNPFGAEKSDEDTQRYLDRCLGHLQGEERDVAGLRAERGELAEKMMRFDDAVVEYSSTLEAGDGDGESVVFAAGRLAKILEWRGEDAGALEVLQKGVEAGKEGKGKVNAMFELAVFLARHGEIAKALEMVTEVLVLRRAASKEVVDPKRFTRSIGDPCKIAATEAVVGELLFALRKREEGVRWSEDAFEKAFKLVDLRTACKECAGVAAGNLVKMGELMKADLEKEGKEGKGWSWFWRGSGEKREEMMKEAEKLVEEYGWKKFEVDSVKAVRDAEIAKASFV
ncbi:hypothetical protein BDD12DRAFT_885209 [Trichophaea hybrida]|nr:hypothetical protein BDD12DRAFT_885209 [Trichophaea hybrida]